EAVHPLPLGVGDHHLDVDRADVDALAELGPLGGRRRRLGDRGGRRERRQAGRQEREEGEPGPAPHGTTFRAFTFWTFRAGVAAPSLISFSSHRMAPLSRSRTRATTVWPARRSLTRVW